MKQNHQRNDLYDQVQDAKAVRQRHVHIASPPFLREERRLICKKPPFLCREEATAITVWYASGSFYHVFCRLSRKICSKNPAGRGKSAGWFFLRVRGGSHDGTCTSCRLFRELSKKFPISFSKSNVGRMLRSYRQVHSPQHIPA